MTDLTEYAALADKTFGFKGAEAIVHSVGGSEEAVKIAHSWFSELTHSALALKQSAGKAAAVTAAATVATNFGVGIAAGTAVLIHDVLSGGAPLIGKSDKGAAPTR